MGAPHVVIVGAGFGGLAAVRALRRAPVRITLLDRRNHHLFQPLLYQVATGGLSPGEIAYPIRAIVRRQRNTQVWLAEAESVDLAARRVRLADGEIDYDFLVLAAGSGQSWFGHPEWQPLAPGLKDLEDALEIRRRILMAFEEAERAAEPERRRVLLTFAIVGGGPTGVELAGALADIARRVMADDFRTIDPRETRIVLLEGAERILPSFPARLSLHGARELSRLGVEVHTGTLVKRIERDTLWIDRGDGTPPQPLHAATTLWAAGVKASPLARSLGTELDASGRARVDGFLRLLDHPEVFVLGDMAAVNGPDGKPLPGVAPVALQQGRWVARAIEGELSGRRPYPFRYHDKGSLAALGRLRAVADVWGLELWGLPAWLVWSVVHILYLIGFRNRVLVAFTWAWDLVSFQTAARLITGRIDWQQVADAGQIQTPRR